jgi:hypothetical protein
MILLATQEVIQNTRKPLELESWSIPLVFWQVINLIALIVIIFLLFKILIKLSKNK